MLNSSKRFIDTASSCDRSTIFKNTLLDAALKNELGFKEQDILPLFLKYQSNRQIIIDFVSFLTAKGGQAQALPSQGRERLTYVLQLPARFYLRRLRKDKFVLNPFQSRFDWFTSSVKLFANKR